MEFLILNWELKNTRDIVQYILYYNSFNLEYIK